MTTILVKPNGWTCSYKKREWTEVEGEVCVSEGVRGEREGGIDEGFLVPPAEQKISAN